MDCIWRFIKMAKKTFLEGADIVDSGVTARDVLLARIHETGLCYDQAELEGLIDGELVKLNFPTGDARGHHNRFELSIGGLGTHRAVIGSPAQLLNLVDGAAAYCGGKVLISTCCKLAAKDSRRKLSVPAEIIGVLEGKIGSKTIAASVQSEFGTPCGVDLGECGEVESEKKVVDAETGVEVEGTWKWLGNTMMCEGTVEADASSGNALKIPGVAIAIFTPSEADEGVHAPAIVEIHGKATDSRKRAIVVPESAVLSGTVAGKEGKTVNDVTFGTVSVMLTDGTSVSATFTADAASKATALEFPEEGDTASAPLSVSGTLAATNANSLTVTLPVSIAATA